MTTGSKLQNNPDWQDLIIAYVREHGWLDGSQECLPKYDSKAPLTLRSIKNATYPQIGIPPKPNVLYIESFAHAIKQAQADYQIMHMRPADDPEFRRDVFRQMRLAAKSGDSNIQKIEYDKNKESPTFKKVIGKTYSRAGVPGWLYEAAFPKQEFTEEAILCVLANMFQDLGESQTVTGATREMILTYLADWKRRAVEELRLKGMKTRYIEPEETGDV